MTPAGVMLLGATLAGATLPGMTLLWRDAAGMTPLQHRVRAEAVVQVVAVLGQHLA
jgi:hypothetical protein